MGCRTTPDTARCWCVVAVAEVSDFGIDVKTRIKASNYKVLIQAAKTNNTTVDALIAELVRRGVEPKKKQRRTKINAEMVARIRELSELHYSDREIGKRVGVSESSAQRYRVMLRIQASRAECSPNPDLKPINTMKGNN